MRNFNNLCCLAIILAAIVGLPDAANAQAGGAVQAIKSAAKSKAALKFADLLAGYLLGKTLDSIYASYTTPNPKLLDEALGKIQKENPDYTLMLGTLRRAAKPDGTPLNRAEFERLAHELVVQMDQSILISERKPAAPALQWNPSTNPLVLPGSGLGLNRQRSLLDGISPELLRDPLSNPLRARDNLPRLTSPFLTQLNNENVLAAKIIGAWSFSHRNNLNAGGGGNVYIFHRNGRITQYKIYEGDEIFTFNGTYTVDGKKLNIRWELPNNLSDFLSATIEELDGGTHLKYTRDKGPFELEEPVAKTLTRVSDVGHFSVITISNPNPLAIFFQIRWATIDGFWTTWEQLKSEPGSMWSIPRTGGFFCQINFDSTLAPGRLDKTSELPFNVVPAPYDPKLLDEGGYRISTENDMVDFIPEKLPLSKPAPGVR